MRRRQQRIDKFKYYDLIIYADRGSHSARTLASALGSRRWRADAPERYKRRRPYFRGNPSPLVVNWGSSHTAGWLNDPRYRLRPIWLNGPEACRRAIDKQAFFKALEGRDDVPTLRSTSDQKVVATWLDKGFGVVARKSLVGSGGAGIVILRPGDVIQPAPLYTRYYPKTHEFRAHVFKGKLIDFTQKKLRGGPNEAANRSIRNLDHGWIHAHGALSVTDEQVSKMGTGAIHCLDILGLDFGAVDILACLAEDRQLKSYRICEVNTGPGLENIVTIQAYANAILKVKNGNNP